MLRPGGYEQLAVSLSNDPKHRPIAALWQHRLWGRFGKETVKRVKKWGADSFDKLQEARAGSGAKRLRLVEQIKARNQRAADVAAEADAHHRRFDAIDIPRALSFAAGFRLQRFDLVLGEKGVPNRPMLTLVETFLQGLVGKQSSIVLQWPAGQRDMAILHPLAMLAALGSASPQVQGRHRWSPAIPDFRTLFFPWRGGAGRDQRGWLVDRACILGPNAPHLTRRLVQEPEHSQALGYLHETFGHLSRLSLRDGTYPHLAHPTLAELFPIFTADGGEAAVAPFTAVIHDLFGRVRHGAAIDRLTDHRATLTDPARAPFALFGITPRADLRTAFAHPCLDSERGGRPPDICLVDLCFPALRRLGFSWEDAIARFLERLLTDWPTLPIVAVTQDAYVQRRFQTLLRKSKTARTAERTGIAAPVLLRRTSDLCLADPPITNATPITAEFQSTAGPIVTALDALSAAASGCSDANIAGALRRSAANLRRAASLPWGIGPAYEALRDLEGEGAAEAFLESRAESNVLLNVKRALDSEISAADRRRLDAADTAVRAAYAAIADDTPIGSALAALALSMKRSSSFSIVVFADETEQRLAQARFAGNREVRGVLAPRMAKGQVKITHAAGLEAILAEIDAGAERNSWKRLILVAPRLGLLDQLMIRAWLPEQLVILCDRKFAVRVAASYHGLAGHAELRGDQPIGERLRAVAAAAKREAQARAVATIDLELEARPVLDVPDPVVDLTDGDVPDAEAVLVTLQSGRILRARPGSPVILHRRDAAINPFDRETVRDLRPGDTIVVPDRAFVDAARRVLPIQVLAQEWVKTYHHAVVAALPGIAGSTLAAKARTVFQTLRPQLINVTTEAAVQDWLRAEVYLTQPSALVRPHAPGDRSDFEAFAALLGIPEAWVPRMWIEGIEQLRGDRRRAGHRMAQAFISVLVDPHGAASGLPPELREAVAQLRIQALDHLDTVIGREDPQRDQRNSHDR